MADICFRTDAFATDPEGDLEYCNGMPGSQVAGWIRGALLNKGYACREPIQEDYGWGFWIDADGCSIWVYAGYAAPLDHTYLSWLLTQLCCLWRFGIQLSDSSGKGKTGFPKP